MAVWLRPVPGRLTYAGAVMPSGQERLCSSVQLFRGYRIRRSPSVRLFESPCVVFLGPDVEHVNAVFEADAAVCCVVSGRPTIMQRNCTCADIEQQEAPKV